jgi:DNA invertase Pin-like site-specific DNA recombinase
VQTFADEGVSGAKGRDERPGLDAMLKVASRGKFDVVMVWAIDRLGRSMRSLIDTVQHLEACKVDLFIDQQNIDTTVPTGKLLFHIMGALSEFERSLIKSRVNAGLARHKEAIARHGKFVTKKGIVRRRLGRPSADEDKIEIALEELRNGASTRQAARVAGLSPSTVQRLKGMVKQLHDS